MVLGLLKTKAHGFEQYLKEQYGSNFGPVLKELLAFKLKSMANYIDFILSSLSNN